MTVGQRLQRWIWPQRGERLKAGIVYGLVALLVTTAVVLTGVRLLLASAPTLTATVEQAVGERLGAELEIGGLDARLQGLRPGLVLSDVTLRARSAPDGRPLQLDTLTLAIAPWQSLQARGLRLHGLEAAGLDVTVRHDPEQGWRLSGLLPLPVPRTGAPTGQFLAALRGLPVDRLLIRDSRLRVEAGHLAAPLDLAPVALRWRRAPDGEWRFALDARAGEQRLRGRLQLPAGREAQATGLLHFDAIRGDLLDSLGLAGGVAVDGGARMAGRAWLVLDDAGLVQVRAELEATDLGVGAGAVDRLTGLAQWQRTPNGWRAGLHPRSVLDQRGNAVGLGGLAVGRDGAGPWRLHVTELPAALLAGLGPGPGMEGASAWLSGLAGDLRNARLVWKAPGDWRATLQGTTLRHGGTGPVPTMSAQRLRLAAGPRGGEARIDGAAAQIAPADLLRNPVALRDVSGLVRWWRTPEGEWRIGLSDGAGVWSGAPVNLAGAVWWLPGRTPVVDLAGSVGALPASTVMAHLPVGVMHPKLVAWLDAAIDGGRLRGLDAQLRGPLDAFPFDNDSGLFDLQARLEGVGFTFNPAWPAFSDAGGILRFRNRSMQMDADSGVIRGVRLERATAVLDDLWSPRLAIDGVLNGPLARMAAIVRRSPLPGEADLPDAVTWDGDGRLDLSVSVPFGGRPPTASGTLSMTDAAVTLPDPAITLSEISGEVDFDADGVRWDGLRAQHAGHAIVSRARTEGSGPAARIRIDATGTRGLADWPGLAALAPYASGETRWRLRWEQPGFAALTGGRGGARRLDVQSDLAGLSVTAPWGLDKPAAEAVDLTLDWAEAPDGTATASLAYGERLRLRQRQTSAGARSLAVHFGATAPSLPAAPVTRVTGTLPVLNIADLRPAPEGGDNLAGQAGIPPLDAIAVELAGLNLWRWRLPATRIRARPAQAGWTLELSGGAQGTLDWSADRTELAADLAALQLEAITPAAPESDQDPTPPAEPSGGLEPGGVTLQLDAEQLTAAGEALGTLAVRMAGPDQGERQASLRLTGDVADVEALVEPATSDTGGYRLRFDVFAYDAGRLLRALGLPQAMNQGRGSASGDLAWIGPMLRPSLPTLAGDLQIDLRNGGLPAIEPGAGRALGLFSLSVLPRRLGLDFSDVVGERLRFDQLQGTWTVRTGRLHTSDLALSGPSLNLWLTGSTDLVRERYDQEVTVRPRISSALSFLGGLAGGPAAAIMLFLTRDMIEPEVDRLSEIRYRIEGPWEDPRFELITPTADD